MSLGYRVFLKSLFKRNFLLSIAASNASLWSKLSSLTKTSLVSIIFLCIGSFFSCLIHSRTFQINILQIFTKVLVTISKYALSLASFSSKPSAVKFCVSSSNSDKFCWVASAWIGWDTSHQTSLPIEF